MLEVIHGGTKVPAGRSAEATVLLGWVADVHPRGYRRCAWRPRAEQDNADPVAW